MAMEEPLTADDRKTFVSAAVAKLLNNQRPGDDPDMREALLAAWNDLGTLWRPTLRGYVVTRGLRGEDVRMVVDEAMASLLETALKKGGLYQDPANGFSVWAWVKTVAKNATSKVLEKNRLEEEHIDRSAVVDELERPGEHKVESEVVEKDTAERWIQQLIQMLNPTQLDILRLLNLGWSKTSEIALELGLLPQVVSDERYKMKKMLEKIREADADE